MSNYHASLTYAKIRDGKIIRTFTLYDDSRSIAEFETLNKKFINIEWFKDQASQASKQALSDSGLPTLLEGLANA